MDFGNFNEPSETREFNHGHIDVVNVGNRAVMKTHFEPGWSWSGDIKPMAGTESCQVAHFMVGVQGQLSVTMDDGTTKVFGVGDVGYVPPGHDAYVVGDETFIAYDFGDVRNYAKGD